MNVKSNPILDIFTFFRISLLELRANGIMSTMLSLVIPLGILAMVYFIGGLSNPDLGLQMISGNLTLVLSQTCIVFLSSEINGLKLRGGFEQYSLFPIYRPGLVISTILFRMILLIPYVIVLMVIAVFLFSVQLKINWLVIAFIFLGALNFSCIGIFIGFSSRNYRKTEMRINFIMFIVMFGTPLFYSITALPEPLQVLQLCLPFAYIVDVFKQLLVFTGYTYKLLLDLIAICLHSIIMFTLASFSFKWNE